MEKESLPDFVCDPRRIGLECLGFNVRKAARVLAKAYDEALAPCDLRSTQFSILVGLKVVGPLAMREFSDLLKMDRTTLTRNLKPLERRGLVRAVPGTDRRARFLSLTGEGEKLLAVAVPHWQGVQERLVKAMGEEKAQNLRSSLVSLSKIAEG